MDPRSNRGVTPPRAEDEPSIHELARLLYAERLHQRSQARAAEAKNPKSGNKRDRQNAYIETLGREIEELKRQVEVMTESRDLLVSRRLQRFDDLDGSSVKAVVEYFRVFRRGLILAPVDAIAFLENVLAEHIQINGFVGRAVVIEQWKTHSMCWEALEVELEHTVVVPLTDEEVTVRATGMATFTISRLTVPVLFPHIIQFRHLVKQLVGRKVTSHWRQDFVYDARKQQFVRMIVSIDFVAAFARLLPQPATLAELFDGALITDEFFIGDVDEQTRQAGAGRAEEVCQLLQPDREETKEDISSAEPNASKRRRHRLV